MFRAILLATLNLFKITFFHSAVWSRILVASVLVNSLLLHSSTAFADDHDDMQFSEIGSFNDFLEWVEEEFEEIKDRHRSKTSNETPLDSHLPETTSVPPKEAPAIDAPLDLSLPEESLSDDTNFEINERKQLNMPDLFSNTVEPADKDTSTTSFGGRILMDDGFEELNEYRLQDIKDSIQGAELTFEVKTN